MNTVQTAWKPLFVISPDTARKARMYRLSSVRPSNERPAWIRLDRAVRSACPIYRIPHAELDVPIWRL
ncbi:MAG: hypothetical protein COV99_10905 [Bacteroidetes bacterium CG12_big_fil_rev_8_21_14_0_65_60_17]|nr:MAG: hypothetical protein COV99_10905 [Bacteroidetes bacterium CG12_big_fil_rev_8_21_14_0_65_60_17]